MRHNEGMDKPVAPSLAARIAEWPRSVAAGRGAERFQALKSEARTAHPPLAALLEDPDVESLLKGVFEGSPYLTTLANRDYARLARILAEPPEARFSALTENVVAAMGDAVDIIAAKRALRVYKSEVALLTALADLAGVWPVMTVTGVLSECADIAIVTAVRFLFRMASARGQWRPPEATNPAANPEVQSDYFVLALGKLGAFELNYSSDVDLTVFFDRDKSRLVGDGDLQ